MEDIIKKHYQEEAEKYGQNPFSTTGDFIIREKEKELIASLFSVYSKKDMSGFKILDIGCGNGYMLSVLSDKFAENNYTGIDNSKELLKIAKTRKIKNCKFLKGDAKNLPFEDKTFDIVYTERCLINILDWKDQKKALLEIHRVLKPEGIYLMIEAFTDGLENLNKARVECRLKKLAPKDYNLYFDKEKLQKFLKKKFKEINITEIPWNFLSSYYFISRVLHPLVSKTGDVKNTEFVKFFSHLEPMGNYSQVQAFIFRKI